MTGKPHPGLPACCESPDWWTGRRCNARPVRVDALGLLTVRADLECQQCGSTATVEVTLSDAQWASLRDGVEDVVLECIASDDVETVAYDKNTDCGTCDGSGGGPDPATRCGSCGGTGERR